MSVVEHMGREAPATADVAVQVVDCDVHPSVQRGRDIAEWAQGPWRDRLARSGHEAPGRTRHYDSPDYHHTSAQRADAVPPDGGPPCSDPAFAYRQLMMEGGVDVAILQPTFGYDQVRDPEVEHAIKVAQNHWLADVWLDHGNRDARWRGSICVTHREPDEAAREIERWAGHPLIAQVLMTPQTRGVAFGDPRLDPIYAAATRHGLPVATHFSGAWPFEVGPMLPVGNPSYWADYMACAWPLLYMTHLMSLVFNGTFERFPELRVVFVEGSYLWVLPALWRMDAIWERRRGDLPQVKRRPSEYVREHVFLTTQPFEDAETSELKAYFEWMDAGSLMMFSTDYPHWTYDDPSWVRKRLPGAMQDRVMHENAIELYGLPRRLPPVPGRA